jgi:hypothetical protein
VDTPSLRGRASPWVVVTAADDPWVTAELAAFREQGGLEVRLDARELLEPAALFRAFAAKLSFPGYFGHNWDALVDSLSDPHAPWRHGRDGTGLAVLIDDADLLLGAEHLGLFVSVLCQAAWRTNLRLDADGAPYVDPPVAMHFVLLLNELSPAEFAGQVGSGKDVATEMVDGRLTATLTGDWPGAA